MSFMDEVPSQVEALTYLNRVINEENYRKVYVGGHSKGGNLAVYAAVHLDESLKFLIEGVFNNDGPGFKNTLLNTLAYKAMQDRIITLIPQSSVVGLLLEHEENYRIIKSSQTGIMQHDGFSWEVLGTDFVYLPELDEDAKIVDITAKRTLEKMSPEQRETFVNAIFELLSVNENKTFTNLSEGGFRNLIKVSQYFNELDDTTKKLMTDILSLYFDESFQSFLEVTELNQWQSKLKALGEETKKEWETFFLKFQSKDGGEKGE